MIKNYSYLILNRLPMTRIKLFIAKVLYKLIRIFIKKDLLIIQRQGINYSLDLREGIDLSIYIFGHFQSHISKNSFFSLPDNAIILDIGANIGSMSLAFAKFSKNARVYAMEPTDYCFKKLLTNLELNPALKERITPFKLLVSDNYAETKNHQIFSSWKIDKNHKNSHPIHGGLANTAKNTPCLKLDDFCYNNQINTIDLIKIDTDGHEFKILKGATKILDTIKPVIIFEIGHYIMLEYNIKFYDYYTLLSSYGYRFFSLQHKKEITLSNFRQIIPKLSTIDIIAITQ